MTNDSIPSLLRDVLTVKVQQGESVRLVHEYQSDGSVCSEGKDPCLNVTRTKNGFKYFCHRCHEQGYFPATSLSPEETAAVVNRIQYPCTEETVDDQGEFDLPDDCVDIAIKSPNSENYAWNSLKVPFDALKWLWSYGLTEPLSMWELDVRWSAKFQRIIFPIYNTKFALDGWVGRNVDGQRGMPKWLTRKANDKDDRLLYITEGKGKVVWVEDIISAIRVNQATGYIAIALLTTSISYDICCMYKYKPQVLWLDGDMKSKMMKYVMKMSALGIKMKMQYSKLDPKEYIDSEIVERIGAHEKLHSDTGK